MFLLIRNISGLFCDLGIFSHSITLWAVSQAFAEDLEKQRTAKKWQEVYSQYKAIRKLSVTINIALGSVVTWFMAEAIAFYSINLVTTLATPDVYRKLFMSCFYLITFSTLLFSASACSQVHSIGRI